MLKRFFTVAALAALTLTSSVNAQSCDPADYKILNDNIPLRIPDGVFDPQCYWDYLMCRQSAINSYPERIKRCKQPWQTHYDCVCLGIVYYEILALEQACWNEFLSCNQGT